MRSIFTTTTALAALAFAAPVMADHHGKMDHSKMDHSKMSAADMAVSEEMTAALADTRRGDDGMRDQYRNPAETLGFFAITPGMTVADVVPGGGWYSRVLIPYLGAEGKYIGLNPDVSRANNDRIRDSWGGYAAKFPEQLAKWNYTDSTATGMNVDDADEAMAGTVDRVVIFREMHNLHRMEMLHSTLQGARMLLKEDGMLGIVQHRAEEDAPADYTDGSKGYMRQKDIIGMVEAHGFELVDTSEINANPADTADHPKGVWEMKPSWGTKRPELENLGESDRMTLLFRKRA